MECLQRMRRALPGFSSSPSSASSSSSLELALLPEIVIAPSGLDAQPTPAAPREACARLAQEVRDSEVAVLHRLAREGWAEAMFGVP